MLFDEAKLASIVKAAAREAVREVLREERDRDDDETMSKAEVAEFLDCTERSVTNYMARENLPYSERHGRVVFRRPEVKEWKKVHGRPTRRKAS